MILALGVASPISAEEERLELTDGEFRFETIEDAETVVLRPGAELKEDKSEDARTVAISKGLSVGTELLDDGDGWYYIESGESRGFVQQDGLIPDKVTDEIVKGGTEPFDIATAVMKPSDNSAQGYVAQTANYTVVEGIRMKSSAETYVMENPTVEARIVGTLHVGTVCYVLEESTDGWMYIESGDVRGFVMSSALVPTNAETEAGEPLAELTVDLSENRATRYTMRSIAEYQSPKTIIDELIEFAGQFLGTPYVWGGEDLLNGVDCSGYCMKVYEHFGYYLPRVAQDQHDALPYISLDSLIPGDLIFFGNSLTDITHVALYIGDGLTYQAAGRAYGVCEMGIAGNALCGGRVIDPYSY